jgi:hypothetical protein
MGSFAHIVLGSGVAPYAAPYVLNGTGNKGRGVLVVDWGECDGDSSNGMWSNFFTDSPLLHGKHNKTYTDRLLKKGLLDIRYIRHDVDGAKGCSFANQRTDHWWEGTGFESAYESYKKFLGGKQMGPNVWSNSAPPALAR